MGSTPVRCHLCQQVKPPTATGDLLCPHCDTPCTAPAEGRVCEHCRAGAAAPGRGPSSSLT